MKWSISVIASMVLLLLMNTGCGDSHYSDDRSDQNDSLIGKEPKWGSEGDINHNVYYGDESGMFLPDHFIPPSGMKNLFVGYNTGYDVSSGLLNTFYGYMSGLNLLNGSDNVLFGAQSAYLLEEGSRNVIVGTESAYNLTGINDSVFLGFHAGYQATRDNTLYIANSKTNDPLIYGEFDTGFIRINGGLGVSQKTTFEGNVSIAKRIMMKGESVIHGHFQCEKATLKESINLSSSAAFESSDPLELLTLEWNNTSPFGDSSDVALEMGTQGELWHIQTMENFEGLAIWVPKTKGSPVEMTLTPADGPDGLQILMGDGGKYANGQWLDASSRVYKENIRALGETEALTAFKKLQPVHYNYKTNKNEPIVGFIAEDVPDLVAPRDHKSLSALEMTALLTKVVQVERRALQRKHPETAELQSRQERMERELDELKALLRASRLQAGRNLR